MGPELPLQRMLASGSAAGLVEFPERAVETGYRRLAPNDPLRPVDEQEAISLSSDDPLVLWGGALG